MRELADHDISLRGSGARTAGPRLPTNIIPRARLIEAIDVGTRGTATVISAGAGWGKSTLAASWSSARAVPGPIAWLTVHDEHNDPDVFWSDLLRAMASVGVVLPGNPPAVDERDCQRRIGVAAARLRTPVVVVLDDVHKLVDRRVLGGLGSFVRRAPAQVRFVLSGRHATGISLHQLRVSGELTEIGAADLAFRVDEATALLTLLGGRMTAAQLAATVRHVEGWPVGLRLALLADGSPRPERAADTYLFDEVLAGQLEVRRRFLLRTSVPDRICGPLADALTGNQDGQRTLEQLASENSFIESVGSGRWFRYHPSFRAALRRRLQSTEPAIVPQLHLRSARWHAVSGDILPALTHAAVATNWQLVAELVVGRGLPMFASPDRADFVEVLDRIPPERLSDSAELALCGALVAYQHGDLPGMSQPLGVARALRAAARPHRPEPIDVALGLIESATLVRWQGDLSRLLAISTDLIADAATLYTDQGPALAQYRTLALSNKAVAMMWLGHFDHADRYLWAAASNARAAGLPLVGANSLGHLALLAFFRGSVGEAEEHATAAMTMADRADAPSHPVVAAARLARALIELERGRDVQAAEELRRSRQAGGEIREFALTVVAALVRARILTDSGDESGARAALRDVWTHARPLRSPLLVRLSEVTESEIDLAFGGAAAVVARYGGGRRLSPSEQLCLARAYLAGARESEGEALLAVIRASADRVSAVAAWVFIALMADAHGRVGQAGVALQRALALAEPERIRRPFQHLDSQRVFALAETQQWLAELRDAAGDDALAEITGELPTVVPAALPLSEREMEVLQYLPTMLTAGEIADNLTISVNTVKAHMRSIYRKFGAGRRREAVVVARQLGLL